MKWENIIRKEYGHAAQLIIDWFPDPIDIISFDCATKSMGVCHLTIDPVVVLPRFAIPSGSSELKLQYLKAYVTLLGTAIDRVVQIQYLDVWDLVPEQSFKDFVLEETAKRLVAKIRSSPIPQTPQVAIYEYQMSANDKSRSISHFLVYHYSMVGSNVARMGATVKNKIALPHTQPDIVFTHPYFQRRKKYKTLTSIPKLAHQYFLQVENDKYSANKKHCAANLIQWAHTFGVQIGHIPVDNLDDAGDAFMQALGWLNTAAATGC